MEKKTSDFSNKELFQKLFEIHTEQGLLKFKAENPKVFADKNWSPVLNSNYKINEGPCKDAQIIQSIVKELSLGIESVLQKEFSNKSLSEPSKSVSYLKMRNISYPDFATWINYKAQKKQAKKIQMLADGERLTPSLTIYTEGVGYSAIGLDLHLGSTDANVEDKSYYRMPPPIVFSGTEGYELICSRNDENDDFVFTLIAKFQSQAGVSIKYLKEKGGIFSFKADKLELGLFESLFNVGTIKKIYSLRLPKLSRSVISRDLRQSINEYLISPLLPILMVDRAYRYPKDIFLQRELFGLGYELEHGRTDLLSNRLSRTVRDKKLGIFRIRCSLFREEIGNLSYNQVRRKLQQYFFRNKMAIVFTLEGRVVKGLSSDYISDILHLERLKAFIHMEIICDEINEDTKNLIFGNDKDNESLSAIMEIIRINFCELGGELYEEEKRRKPEKLTNS